MATMIRGRAASPVRPGFLIKSLLSGEIPNEDGERVTESAIVDIHHVYKAAVREAGMLRSKHYKPMVYSSFVCLFRFAEKLGLVELVRSEPMLYPPPHGHLYTTRRHDGAHIQTSTRNVYRLTELGKQDELSWSNLTRAYLEHWLAPQKLIVPIPTVAPTKYKFSSTPSSIQLTAFMNFLISMKNTGIDQSLLRQLSEQVGDWSIYFEDRLKTSNDKDKYRHLRDDANRLSDELFEYNIDAAIATARDMVIYVGK